jgi:hypothetical protein
MSFPSGSMAVPPFGRSWPPSQAGRLAVDNSGDVGARDS